MWPCPLRFELQRPESDKLSSWLKDLLGMFRYPNALPDLPVICLKAARQVVC